MDLLVRVLRPLVHREVTSLAGIGKEPTTGALEMRADPRSRRPWVGARSRRVPCGVCAAAALGLALGVAHAAPPRGEEARALAAGAEARERGDAAGAVAVLKAAWDDQPDSAAITVALAMAYLAADNPTWAARVLGEHLDYHPEDCDPRFLLAWVHLTAGMPDLAREVLDARRCDGAPELRAREQLLRAYLSHVEGNDDDARRRLERVRRSPRIFAEDRELLAQLTRDLEPARAEPIARGSAELGVGYSSNGLAGSPADLAAPETAASALLVVDARLRVAARRPTAARPWVEAGLRTQELAATAAQDLSFRTGTVRAGVLLPAGATEVLLALASDATELAGGDRYDDGPLWFSEAHRAEIELGLGDSLVLFAGGGRRWFRELGRTRTEAEASLGWATSGPFGIRAIGGFSARAHDAQNDAYDLIGASGVSQVWVPIALGLELAATYAVSVDAYPRSADAFAGARGSERRDALIRTGLGAWWPRRAPVRLRVLGPTPGRRRAASALRVRRARSRRQRRRRGGQGPDAEGRGGPARRLLSALTRWPPTERR
jgi:Flp pilus assembly protein TadD